MFFGLIVFFAVFLGLSPQPSDPFNSVEVNGLDVTCPQKPRWWSFA